MAKRINLKNFVRAIILVGLMLSLTGATCSEIYTRSGTWYRVQKGDTLSSIASRFGTSAQYVAEMNNVTSSKQLAIGQRLYIPNDRKSYASRRTSGAKKKGKGSSKGSDSEMIVVQRGKFIWPVDGVVTSNYGFRRGRRHDGIDISARRGTPIHVAGMGEVVYSSRLRGYGNLILVKHKKGFFTVYAHNSRNLVKKGQKVKRGQVIARVGSSGQASGPHLHFEVRKGSKARNPLFFLPKEKTQFAKK